MKARFGQLHPVPKQSALGDSGDLAKYWSELRHDSAAYRCSGRISTPSGLTLAPEGGQHQSINTPLIGMSSDRLASFEPAYVDELAILLRHAFHHMQQPDGSAVWLRLSTRQLEQKPRALDRDAVIAGGHWVVPPAPGGRIALVYQGPVAPEAAFAALGGNRR